MNKKLKRRLINALIAAGMSEELASNFEGQSESQINNFIEQLPTDGGNEDDDLTPDEILASESFLKAVETLGYDKLLAKSKMLQSAHDKKMAKGFATLKKNLYAKNDDADDDDDDDETMSNAPDWFKSYAKSMDDKLKSLTTETETKTKLAKAKEILTASEVLNEATKTKWLSRIDVNAETSVEDQVKSLETEFTDLFGEGGNDDKDKGYSFSERNANRKKNGELSKDEEAELADMAKSL